MITRSRQSGMHSMLRQLWSALTPKALYSRYQQHGWNTGYRKAEERCHSVPKYRSRWTERMPFHARRRNGLTERPGRMLFRAEVPERVDRKVSETAVPCRSAGTGRPKGHGGRCPEPSARTDEPKGREFEDGNGMPLREGGHRAPD